MPFSKTGSSFFRLGYHAKTDYIAGIPFDSEQKPFIYILFSINDAGSLVGVQYLDVCVSLKMIGAFAVLCISLGALPDAAYKCSE